MKFSPKTREDDVDINLTPLIDVVFLLLIFFMVTTTFSKEAQIKLKLPEATTAEKSDSDQNYIVIQINEIGEFAVKGPDDERARVLVNSSHDTLMRTLRLAGRRLNDPVVVIRADRRTPHEDVVKAMDAARRQGYLQITFSTDQPE